MVGDQVMSHEWEVPDSKIEEIFRKAKHIIEQRDRNIFFDWSRIVIGEITPNVTRTLNNKFQACNDRYKATKIAGLYTFWTAKLKPGFGIMTNSLFINEYLALVLGFSIVRERLDITISLDKDELLDICDTLRYHTSSPHTLMHIFEGWVERERLRIKTRR